MIKFNNINLKFKKKTIFSDFNISINENEKILLNSPSGSGKSTFLKLIMGFTRQDSGEVMIDGNLLDANNLSKIRNLIAYLPQEISLPEMEVKEFIHSVLSYQSNKHIKYDEKLILKLFKDLKLSETILDSNTSTLSGGEKQRIGIVIMQLLERKIFLLDEVTSALNKELKEVVKNYFLNMNNTVIVVSHDECWHDDRLTKLEW